MELTLASCLLPLDGTGQNLMYGVKLAGQVMLDGWSIDCVHVWRALPASKGFVRRHDEMKVDMDVEVISSKICEHGKMQCCLSCCNAWILPTCRIERRLWSVRYLRTALGAIHTVIVL